MTDGSTDRGLSGLRVGNRELDRCRVSDLPGQIISKLVPGEVGFKLTGSICGGMATDVVLTVTQMLREHGLRAGSWSSSAWVWTRLPLANRATPGSMRPEFGSACGSSSLTG